MNWTPVDLEKGPEITIMLNQGSWKEGTFYCYETNKACHYCDNFKFTKGFQGKCLVPYYVQSLLEKGLKPLKKPQSKTGFRKAQ